MRPLVYVIPQLQYNILRFSVVTMQHVLLQTWQLAHKKCAENKLSFKPACDAEALPSELLGSVK